MAEDMIPADHSFPWLRFKTSEFDKCILSFYSIIYLQSYSYGPHVIIMTVLADLANSVAF